MASGSGIAIEFSPVPGILYDLDNYTYTSRNAVQFNVTGPITANSLDYIAFSPTQDCNIIGGILTGGASNVTMTIFDEFGNIDPTYSPITSGTATFGAFKANKNYLVQIANSAALSTSLKIGFLAVSTSPSVYSYFTNGFAPQIPVTGNPTVSTNSFGAVTFTFTNYQAVLGKPILLAVAAFAKQALSSPGTGVAFTCSDNTFEANGIFPFAINQSVGIYFNPLKTGSFTGTIFVTLTNAGTTTLGNLIPVLT
jgi:hypothetical protein